MEIKFLHPYFLILIPLAILFLYFVWKKNNRKFFKDKLFLAVRTIVILLIILSLSGLSIFRHSNTTTHIFTFDVSASTKGSLDKILSDINKTEKNKNDLVGVVSFAQKAYIEKQPSKNVSINSLNANKNSDYTNIGEALNTSFANMPENTKKHIILVTDGVENVGDALLTAKQINDGGKGAAISIIPIKNNLENESQLTQIQVPKSLKKDEITDITIIANSINKNDARLILYKNNVAIADENVSLNKGETKFVFKDKITESGGIIFKAEIVVENDVFSENNIVYCYSNVTGTNNVLLVEKDNSGANLKEILNASSVTVDLISPNEFYTDVSYLNKYDAIILCDISLEDLPENSDNLLESYVKNTGGGLFVTGGENSFALGDYKDSALEKILPVNMELKDKNKKPNLGLVMVIDRSGSMGATKYGGSKLEIAKEAAIRSALTMDDSDKLGVIMFDDKFNWALNLTEIKDNKELIENSIANISLGGGTSILPGLTEAYSALSKSDTKIKHIILLTDGVAEQTGYKQVIQQMNKEGITLSTVAVGSDSDTKLLKYLAKNGNGRYYYSDEFSDLPKIFTKETKIAGKQFINNETFIPSVVDENLILQGVNNIAPLNGYVSTTEKDRADVVFESNKKEPILASWQYGLGRAVAFTSDVKGVWSSSWFNSSDGVLVFKNVLSYILKKEVETNVNVSTKIENGRTKISLFAPFSEGIISVSGTIFEADGNNHKINFRQVSPGQFEGETDLLKQGAYLADFEIEKINKTEHIPSGVSVDYSPEYDLRYFNSGDSLIDKISKTVNASIITDIKNIYNVKLNNVYEENDISSFLLICSLVLFLIDIFLRRFTFATVFLERHYNNFINIFAKKSNKKIKRKNEIKKVINENKISTNALKDVTEVEKALVQKVSTTDFLVLNKKKRSKK